MMLTAGSIESALSGIFVCTYGYLLPGAFFVFLAIIKGIKNPYKEGLAYLKKHFPYPVGFDGNIIDLLDGDKTLELSKTPVNKVIILSSENKFQICNENKYSKIYTGKDVLEYQIKIDNEVVISSNTRSKKGVGKVIVGGTLFGAAGAIAGAVAANKNSNTSHSQKEVQHYTFVLRVNDILNPAYVLELPSLLAAEEIAATFEIICQDSIQGEETCELLEEQRPEATVEKFNPDKFEEIKKYKELLDLGIISQEEFEIEKKRILG